jgi:hypothetical protein
MKIPVPVKRVVDLNVKTLVKPANCSAGGVTARAVVKLQRGNSI